MRRAFRLEVIGIFLIEDVTDDIGLDAFVEEVLAVDEAESVGEVAIIDGLGSLEIVVHPGRSLGEAGELGAAVGVTARVVLALTELVAQIHFLEIAEVDVHLAEVLKHLLAVELLLNAQGLTDADELHEAFGNFTPLEDEYLPDLPVLPKGIINHVVAQLEYHCVVDAHQQHVRWLLFTHLNKYIITLSRRHTYQPFSPLQHPISTR